VPLYRRLTDCEGHSRHDYFRLLQAAGRSRKDRAGVSNGAKKLGKESAPYKGNFFNIEIILD